LLQKSGKAVEKKERGVTRGQDKKEKSQKKMRAIIFGRVGDMAGWGGMNGWRRNRANCSKCVGASPKNIQIEKK